METSGDFPDNDQAYAAGLVEAYLTKDLVIMHWKVRLLNQLIACTLNEFLAYALLMLIHKDFRSHLDPPL